MGCTEPQEPIIDTLEHRSEETMTPSYGSGDLVWDTTEATAPRWILLLDGPPGAARQGVGAVCEGVSASVARALHVGRTPMDDSVHAARDALQQRFQALATQLRE